MLCLLFSDPPMAAELGRAGQERARQLSWRPAGEAILRALEAVAGEPTTFAARLNLVLAEEGDSLLLGLAQNISGEARTLRQLIAFEFAALTFYATALIGAATKRPGNQLRRELSAHGISFHWGGNGAKFLHWIDQGRYVSGGRPPEARIEPLLRAVAFQGLRDVLLTESEEPPEGLKRLNHLLSNEPKSEAAGGLVQRNPSHRYIHPVSEDRYQDRPVDAAGSERL